MLNCDNSTESYLKMLSVVIRTESLDTNNRSIMDQVKTWACTFIHSWKLKYLCYELSVSYILKPWIVHILGLDNVIE